MEARRWSPTAAPLPTLRPTLVQKAEHTQTLWKGPYSLVTQIPGSAGPGLGLPSHGLREGTQRSRGHAKVTHRAGNRAESPACMSA